MQELFMEKYYNEFTDEEENKLVYTEIFKEYVSFCINIQYIINCFFIFIDQKINFIFNLLF